MKNSVRAISIVAVMSFLLWQNLPSTKVVQAAGTTYYVRTDGNNANNGLTNLAAGAWKTIDWAADHAGAGDTVRVQAGTYVETVTPGNSGTLNNTVTLVADGTVTTCGMKFSAKSYIRVIGFTMNPQASTCGGSPSPIVWIIGTSTGLEFWNNDVGHLNGNAVVADRASGAGQCNACIWIGGSIHDVGNPSTAQAFTFDGNDDFVGYSLITTTCYLGVVPSGNRQRFINLSFGAMVACGGHPDFFYFHNSGLGYSNGLIESMFGIGTPTDTDNKIYNSQSQEAVDWNDDLVRFSVTYNMGSASSHSIGPSGPGSINRWRQYNNTHVLGDRGVSGNQYDGCGGSGAAPGTTLTWYIYNTIFYKCWADDASIRTHVNPIAGNIAPTGNDYNLAYDPAATDTFQEQWTSQAHEQSNVDPKLNNISSQDFTLQSGSGARATGGPLTTATSCSGTTLKVAANTGSFFIPDNSVNLPQYGGVLAPGDFITVGSTTSQVSNVSGDTLTLASVITCANGDPVYYGKSSSVDIGAYPYKAGGYNLSASYALTGNTATVTPNDPELVRFAVCYENGIPTTVDNSAPYNCSVGNGSLDVRVYPKYASTTLFATASLETSPSPTPTPGDINLDHIVNSVDYSILNSNWFTTNSQSDLNKDGIVNAIDFSILNANWQKTW